MFLSDEVSTLETFELITICIDSAPTFFSFENRNHNPNPNRRVSFTGFMTSFLFPIYPSIFPSFRRGLVVTWVIILNSYQTVIRQKSFASSN